MHIPNPILCTVPSTQVIGKFKDETNSISPQEFVGLRAKMYSLYVPNTKKKSKIMAKGIKKSYIKHHLRHSAFVNVLHNKKDSSPARFKSFRSVNHVVSTVDIHSLCVPVRRQTLHIARRYLDPGLRTSSSANCCERLLVMRCTVNMRTFVVHCSDIRRIIRQRGRQGAARAVLDELCIVMVNHIVVNKVLVNH